MRGATSDKIGTSSITSQLPDLLEEKRSWTNSVILSLVCTLELPKGLLKMLIVAPSPRESDVIGLRRGSFKSPLDDCNMKARLGTTGLNLILIPYFPKRGSVSLWDQMGFGV